MKKSAFVSKDDIIRLSLNVKTDYSYNIVVSPGILKSVPDLIKEKGLSGKAIVITDTNVASLYADALLAALKAAGFDCDIAVFKAGEASKTRQTKDYLEDIMFEKKYGRDSFVIALGGGVTGDMAGFVAATFNRGIPFVQIPTTILSMVDSSVGGKTGIDTKFGKNLIGAFCQPALVIIDPDTLKTLNKKERLNGIAEMIKHAVIKDKLLFDALVKNRDDIIEVKSDVLKDIIKTNVRIKADVVEEDEKETNLRKILNFGHTIGHGIELLSDYKMGHGECVAIGMVVEAHIAVLMNYISDAECNKIIECIKGFGLPYRIPKGIKTQDIINASKMDKKALKGRAKYVLPALIGLMYQEDEKYALSIDDEIVKKAIGLCS